MLAEKSELEIKRLRSSQVVNKVSNINDILHVILHVIISYGNFKPLILGVV